MQLSFFVKFRDWVIFIEVASCLEFFFSQLKSLRSLISAFDTVVAQSWAVGIVEIASYANPVVERRKDIVSVLFETGLT